MQTFSQDFSFDCPAPSTALTDSNLTEMVPMGMMKMMMGTMAMALMMATLPSKTMAVMTADEIATMVANDPHMISHLQTAEDLIQWCNQ